MKNREEIRQRLAELLERGTAEEQMERAQAAKQLAVLREQKPVGCGSCQHSLDGKPLHLGWDRSFYRPGPKCFGCPFRTEAEILPREKW